MRSVRSVESGFRKAEAKFVVHFVGAFDDLGGEGLVFHCLRDSSLFGTDYTD